MAQILKFPKRLLLALLDRPRLLMGIGVLLLCLLIWHGGPTMGMKQDADRMLLIGGIVLAWAVVLLYDRYRARRGARLLEESLHAQDAGLRSRSHVDAQDALDDVRSQFERAVATLKQTRLGRGYRGSTALYALPWYMFIGPSASGKSTALRESGLHFPYLGENQKGVQGIGGTRNCDWWFTSEAVLLDTAGRYTTEDEDRDEWLGFLDLLRKYRTHKPINGVIVAVSVADLLERTDHEIEQHAKTIRERIDELMTHLGLVFPVYVVFTKCDLLDGFTQFFGDLTASEREQIWGCTFPRRATTDQSLQDQFDDEFQRLLEIVRRWRLERVTSARGSEKVRALGFPLQLAACQSALRHFLGLLFHQNPYQESPFFRGFYLTSGTQEGNPIDRVVHAVSQSIGVDVPFGTAADSAESKSYFIKKLFTDVIFPDRGLSHPTTAVFRHRGAIRVAAFGAAILGVGLSIFALGSSYLGNKYLVHSVFDEAVALPAIREGITQDIDSEQYASSIAGLDRVRERVDQLRSYAEDGTPARLWGLYDGDRLIEPLKTLYQREFETLVAMPVKRALEARLRQFATRFRDAETVDGETDHYALLKAYLMMGHREHLDPSFLDQQLQHVWAKNVSDSIFAGGARLESFAGAFERILHFYSFHMAGEMSDRMALDPMLVKETRAVLRRVPLAQRLYAQALHSVSETPDDFSLAAVFERDANDTILSDYAVPGLYTKTGWTGAFAPALDAVLEEYAQEYWVLGEAEPIGPEMDAAVRAEYFGDYIAHWMALLRSVRIRMPGTPDDLLALFADLGTAPSPFHSLFKAVQHHTGLVKNPLLHPDDGDSSLIEKVKKKLLWDDGGRVAAGAPPSAFDDPVHRAFHSLHRFVEAPVDGQDDQSALSVYVAQLQEVRGVLQGLLPAGGAIEDPVAVAQTIAKGQANDLTRHVTKVEQLMTALDPPLQRIVEPLLLEPLMVATNTVMERSLQVLNAQWETEVFVPCQQLVAGRYPFEQGGDDMALSDVSQFFHPHGGVLWAFYEKRLKPFVHEGQDVWTSKVWRGVTLPLSDTVLEKLRYARFVSESLFPHGQSGPHVEFDLYPYPDQGHAAPLVSEIQFTLGENVWSYRMGPQEWQPVEWPGTSGAGGARLQVKSNGVWNKSELQQGWWGMFRLVDKARVTPLSDSVFRMEWTLDSHGATPLHIRYDVKARSARNPFHPRFFERFSCVSSLSHT